MATLAAPMSRLSLYHAEMLERRVCLSGTIAESESNDTPGSANVVPITNQPTVIDAAMGYADFDYFTFTLAARSGVFFDTDAIQPGIASLLDTRLTLFAGDGETVIASNDDGRDFDTISLNETSATPLPWGDSALYADLPAGTYIMQVYSWAKPDDPAEPYQLKITADAGFTTAPPALSSLPGAADTLYLDFDGHSASDAWGTYAIDAFDLNGNAAEWTPAERAAIETTWRVVADAFAPFNINVTTNYNGAYADGQAHRQVIGNADGSEIGQPAGSPGIAWPNGFSSGGTARKTGFTFADNFSDRWINAGISGEIVTDAIEIGNASVRAIGRTLGLQHYLGDAHAHAFMHAPDFGLNRARWSSGINEGGAAQDDMSLIAGAANTFGYRADDVGPAGVTLTASGNTYAASGVIHQSGDVDTFHFSGDGSTTITLDIPEHWGHLDGEIYLRGASGALLASDDSLNLLGATLTYTLPAAGNYFVEVKSDGGEGEVGQYALKITTTLPPGGDGTIAGRTFRDTNYNGIYETALGDTIIGGATVYIDANGNATFDAGEQSTTSSALDGLYAFSDLAAATYGVRQVAPNGHVNAQVHSRVITTAGETFGDADFGNFPIVYTGGGGNDSYTIRPASGESSRLEILDSSTPGVVWSAPKSLVPSITIFGNDGNDMLNVNDAPASVTFNGGLDPAFVDTLNLNAGAHTFNADARDATARLMLNVSGAATSVVMNATQHLEGLAIGDDAAVTMSQHGSRLINTGSFSFTGGGRLDLRDNGLIARSAALGTFDGSTYGGVTGYIYSAYNFGAWDGAGLATSMDDAMLNGVTTLGIGRAEDLLGINGSQTDLYNGETVNGNAIIVKYTYAGDANLDGQIDAGDYGILDYFIQIQGSDGYAKGDFNLDGFIDAADYGTIDNSIQYQGLPL